MKNFLERTGMAASLVRKTRWGRTI